MKFSKSGERPERRRFFRIETEISLAYHPLSDEEMRSQVEGGRPPAGFWTALDQYDNQIESLLGTIRVQQPQVAQVLDVLSKKMNLLAGQMALDDKIVEEVTRHLKKVSLSACGMAFVVDEPIDAGKVLSLDMRLQRNGSHLVSYAVVIACEPLERGTYYLRLEFQRLLPSDQELLIQYVVREQSEQLRIQRDQ